MYGSIVKAQEVVELTQAPFTTKMRTTHDVCALWIGINQWCFLTSPASIQQDVSLEPLFKLQYSYRVYFGVILRTE